MNESTGGAEAAGRAETVEPCPWCGRVPNVVPLYPEEPGNDAHMIECGDHRCIGGIDRQTRAQCIDDWNSVVSRVARGQAREAVDAIRALIDESIEAACESSVAWPYSIELYQRLAGIADADARASAARIVESATKDAHGA